MPDLVHDKIASYLLTNDYLRVSETCRPLLASYGCGSQQLTVAWRLRKLRCRTTTTATAAATIITTTAAAAAAPSSSSPSSLPSPVTGVEQQQQQQQAQQQSLSPSSSLSSRDPRQLVTLLTRHPHLRTLDIRDADAITTVASALTSGCCRDLQSLDLRVFSTTDAEIQALASSLESNSVPHLTSLAITCCTPLAWFGYISLMRVLGSGCCPMLREIKLDPLSVEHSDAYLSLLAQALEQRATLSCSPLTTLSLTRWSNRGDDSHASLRRLLTSPLCAHSLERLHLDLSLSPRELHALTTYARETGCPSLRSLRITALDGDRAAATTEGYFFSLPPGVAPHLQTLDILHADVHSAPTHHLATWIASGGYRSLRELRLQRTGLEKEDIVNLMEGVVGAAAGGGGGCPLLRVLRVEGIKDAAAANDDTLISLIASAIREGALPALEDLGLAMTGTGASGVRELARALAGGGGGGASCARRMRLLDLRLCDIGSQGAASIAEVVMACPRLHSLELGPTGQDGARVLAEAFEKGGGRELRRLTLAGMGDDAEGSKAFIRAFRRGACPRLEEVVLLPLDMAGAAVRAALRAKRPGIIVNGYKAGGCKATSAARGQSGGQQQHQQHCRSDVPSLLTGRDDGWWWW